jgi:hypothetical protein
MQLRNVLKDIVVRTTNYQKSNMTITDTLEHLQQTTGATCSSCITYLMPATNQCV